MLIGFAVLVVIGNLGLKTQALVLDRIMVIWECIDTQLLNISYYRRHGLYRLSYGLHSHSLYTTLVGMTYIVVACSYNLYSCGLRSHGLYSYCLYRYALCKYGLCRYGLCKYGLYSYGPHSDCRFKDVRLDVLRRAKVSVALSWYTMPTHMHIHMPTHMSVNIL